MNEQPQRILVFSVNWLGDVLFSSPFYRALKSAYPSARITAVGVPRVNGILKHIPGIDEVVNLDEEGLFRSILNRLKLVRSLRKNRFDTVYFLKPSLSRTWIALAAGIDRRIGWGEHRSSRYLTQTVTPPNPDIHRRDFYLTLLKNTEVPVADNTTEVCAPEEARAAVEEMLRERGVTPEDQVIVLHPGGNWNLKRWPVESFRALIGLLIRNVDAKLIVSGGPGDVELGREVSQGFHPAPLVLSGRLSLPELIALMARADLLITGDSGPLHVAASVGTRTVALFGPTRPEITGPRGRGEAWILMKDVGCNRRPCYYLDCPVNTCMRAISAQDVLDVVKENFRT